MSIVTGILIGLVSAALGVFAAYVAFVIAFSKGR